MLGTRLRGRVISYLPLAHVADRFFSHYQSLLTASSITSLDDAAVLLPTLRSVRPTSFAAAPRTWEKLVAAVADDSTEPREALGLNHADWALCGGIPVSSELLAWLADRDVPVLEMFGMSEIACVGLINPPNTPRRGSVGLPLPGIEVALADDDELLLRGETVMRGYRNDPVQTSEAIGDDGFLRTGDLAALDTDGYVTIVGRKKELIINAAGKNMSPNKIEAALCSIGPLIAQACVIGDARPFNIALLTLDPAARAANSADPSCRGHRGDPSRQREAGPRGRDPVAQSRASLGPESLTWRYLGDSRNALLAARAGILQAMHPAIDAGIREHSDFFVNPWNRIIRSAGPILGVVYD